MNKKMDTRRSILNLSPEHARNFFLKKESYCTFDLPRYINFNNILNQTNKTLRDKNLTDFYNTPTPRDCEDVNYILFHNKDSKYSWRPFQLIHPVIYVSLVQKITSQDNWEIIKKRFSYFSENNKIQCMSIPVFSLSRKKDTAEQILQWWQEIEQKSLELSLDYEYLIETDITDCYGSIYTHSIAWTLHNKETAKKKKGNRDLIGNIIDWHIQDMHYGQTNGIPQGSVLMDFIAEMVLGYADMELSKRISKIDNYHILRYRDDYRIFINNPQDGAEILKLLTEIMIDLGLKINPGKTKFYNQVIAASIKQDKLAWILHAPTFDDNMQKELLIIHNHAMTYPHAGSVAKALNLFDNKLLEKKEVNNVDVLIAIMIDIAYHNPRNYPVFASIVSKLLKFKSNDAAKEKVIRKIRGKFNTIPNTGYMDIWLQRITLSFNREMTYNEKICQLVSGKKISLWNNNWIKSKELKSLIDPRKIIDTKKLSALSPFIWPDEVSLFLSHDY